MFKLIFNFTEENRECLEEFNQVYRSEPSLWLIESDDYHNIEINEVQHIDN